MNLMPSTLVIDDFFSDFDKARAAALECEFRQRGKAFSYRFAQPPDWLQDEGIARIADVLGAGIRDEFIESHLLLATEADWVANLRRGARVHIDEVRWVGVAYLNEPDQCSGGTSFYEHRATRARHDAQLAGSSRDTSPRFSPTAATCRSGGRSSPSAWCPTAWSCSIPASSTRHSTSSAATPVRPA